MKDMQTCENLRRHRAPGKPSERVARRLSGHPAEAPLTLRRATIWMTPPSSCTLTMLPAIGSLDHRSADFINHHSEAFYAATIPNPSAPNFQTVRLSQSHEYVPWNVCPELTPPLEPARSESPDIFGLPSPAATNLNK
jgi:hypothetical protein